MKEAPVCDECGEYQDECKCTTGEPPVRLRRAGYVTLTWTAEKPKRRGWWWVKGIGIPPVVVNVFETEAGGLRFSLPGFGQFSATACYLELWWSGPLVEPQEPSESTAPHSAEVCESLPRPQASESKTNENRGSDSQH